MSEKIVRSSQPLTEEELFLIEHFGETEESVINARKTRNEERKQRAMESIQRTGLDYDSYNNWAGINYTSGENTPIPRYYEAYVRSSNIPEVADFILKQSSPEAVGAHDALVDEIILHPERSKEFHDRALKLIRNK